MPLRRSSLARRIAYASVGISILSGLGLGAVSAISDYRRSFDLALENHGRIIQAALPQLESAYWDLDLAAVQATLDRLAETPLVQEVRIRDQVFSAEELASVAVPDLVAQSDRPRAPVWPLSRIVPADWLVATHDLALYGRAGPDPIASLSVRLNYAGLYDDLGYRALSLMATTMLQALLIAGLLFLLIRDRIISPLNALAKAARSHRESGTFRLDGLPVTRGGGNREDEISVLARDFGRTVMRMERYRDHLQEEVDQRTAELVVARNDALAASRAKSAFLANMSHEMRTPLNAITGLSDLVLAEGQTPATRRHINDMRHAARQLLGSIDQVLDLSKLEAGQIRYAHAPYHPVEVFDEVIAQTRVLAAGKPISVEGDLDPAIPPVLLGDGQKITQILLNLTSNAVKFTESGRIRLHLHRREGWLRITVADTGSGIATAQRAAVFSPFTQGNESASRNVSGTGLGLTIARQMAEGMGGALTLASRAGRGSLFVLRLPLVAAAERAPPDRAPLDCPAL
uniref:sensor histidine kinase n=1 Tax=Xinfangfangia pollutisoli TaxID=2865960 RepID=UPI0021E56903